MDRHILSSIRLESFVFERIPSWIIGALFIVWSLAGFMGLRNALMITLCVLSFAQFFRRIKSFSLLTPRWLWGVAGLFFLHTILSLIFSIDRGYSAHRWWGDYGTPLLLAFAAAQFARTLNERFVTFCMAAGLLLNGVCDLYQVFTIPAAEAWRGFFSDYGWQNGYFLLSLPLGLLLLPPATDHAYPRGFTVFLIVSCLLGFMASLSSWARANQLCFLSVVIPVIAILICRHGNHPPFQKRIILLAGLLCLGAVFWRLTPAATFLGPLTTWEWMALAMTIPLGIYLISPKVRFRLIPWIIPAAIAFSLIGLAFLYYFANLKDTHSELVRKYSYIEFFSKNQPAPILGFGPGRDIVFQGIPKWPVRQNQYLLDHGISHPYEPGKGHTHIQWINWRYEIGYPGLILLMILLGGSVWRFVGALTRDCLSPFSMILGAGLLAFALNIFMGQLFTAGLAQQFWLMWGLFIANCGGKSKSAN